MSYVDNTSHQKKPHGRILSEIAKEFRTYLMTRQTAILVREQALAVRSCGGVVKTLNKVVGITDLCAWNVGHREFYEMHPSTIRKLVTGNGKAKKQEVADALEKYVGPQTYEVDDLSDAVAVGIAWLIKNNYIEQISNK